MTMRVIKGWKCTSCLFDAQGERRLAVDDAKPIDTGAESGIYDAREGGNDTTQMGEGRGLAPLVESTGRRAQAKRGRKPSHRRGHAEAEPWIDEVGKSAHCGVRKCGVQQKPPHLGGHGWGEPRTAGVVKQGKCGAWKCGVWKCGVQK